MAFSTDITRHRENRDLMHASSEDLFADPLHVRDSKRPMAMDAGGLAEPAPLRASRGATEVSFAPAGDRLAHGRAAPVAHRSRPHEGGSRDDVGFDTRVFDRRGGGGGYRPPLDDEEYTRQEYGNGHSYANGHGKEDSLWGNTTSEWEDTMQETFGYVVSSMWSIVAGGRQCCSMRDRRSKEDLEAAKRAALTGRPPKRELDARPETPQAARVREHHRNREPYANDFEEVEEEEPPYINHTPDNSLNAAQSLGPVPNSSLPADGFREDPFLTGRKLPEAGFERSAPALAPPMSSRLEREDREEQVQGNQAPPESALPNKWEWPPWCLNFKSPNIEVWVLDEDAGIGRWVSAQPQSRVVDKSGRDAYLCAEYLWDGEYYVQDFGPQHVRRKGEIPTVLQTLTQSEDPELEATKVFKKNGGSEALMETKVFKDKKKSKQEGGLSAILASD